MANYEYLVYKSDNTNLDEKEAAAVYAVLCILPYPMNTNPLHAPYIAKLTKRQRALLDSNEGIVVLEKLREINPKIRILKFPKSMYQFYISMMFEERILSQYHAMLRRKFVKFAKLMAAQLENLIAMLDIEIDTYLPKYRPLKEDMVNGHRQDAFAYEVAREEYAREDQRNSTKWFFLGDRITYIHYDFDKRLYYKRCHSANTFPFKTQFWAAINEALLAECEYVNRVQYYGRLHALASIWCERHTNCVIDDIKIADTKLRRSSRDPSEYLWVINQFPYILHLVKEFTPLLHKIFQFEIKCMGCAKFNNLYVIYRGSYLGPNGDYALSRQKQHHRGLSFGDGLFAGGGPKDPGAVAWNFISGWGLWVFANNQQAFERYFSPNTGYALLLTKQQASEMFEIPPLTNLTRVFGSGEYFHARSKLANTDPDVSRYILTNYIMLSDKRRERVQNYRPCTVRLLMEHELAGKYGQNMASRSVYDCLKF